MAQLSRSLGEGIKGQAVSTNIRSVEQLDRALDRIRTSKFGATGVVLERMVSGRDYRVLATRHRALSVVRRDPAAVVGDGVHTLAELVLATNAVRRQNPHLGKRLVKLNSSALELLDRQGLAPSSVPAKGQRVWLSEVANLSQGGRSTELLESTHPSLLALAVDAVAAIPGLPYGGVDIMLEDHTRPVTEQNVVILEINHNPALLLHHYPLFGPARNVCGELVRELALSHGLVVRPRQSVLSVTVAMTGQVQGVGFRRWFAQAAERLDLDGWVANSVREDEVRALVRGPAQRVGALLWLAYEGPGRARPRVSYVEPTSVVPPRGFHIRFDAEGLA